MPSDAQADRSRAADKPSWVAIAAPKHQLAPAWQTIENNRIKNVPDIKGIKVPERGAPNWAADSEDFKCPPTGRKAEKAWTAELRSSSARPKEQKAAFWTPGTGRGKAEHPSGGTRGNREGKVASVANLLPRAPAPLPGHKDAWQGNAESWKPPTRADVEEMFAYLVCEEKQDGDCYPKQRTVPVAQQTRDSTNKDTAAASPGAKSALSTQPSTPRSPRDRWDRGPFTPRRGLKGLFDEKAAEMAAESESKDWQLRP